MKTMNAIVLLPVIALIAAGVTLAGTGAGKPESTVVLTTQCPATQSTWEIPIAAGVWYPTDGPVPEHPVRYYRIRCWPGCHTGSTYGLYPKTPLSGKPIFPTSTIDVHSQAAEGKAQ
jgi:hypothetical protein